MELMGKASERLELDELRDWKRKEKTSNDDAKENMDKIFAKKQVGLPVRNWESKTEQYLMTIKSNSLNLNL